MRKVIAVFAIIICSCNQKPSGIEASADNSWREKYFPLITEIHSIECEHLKRASASVTATNTYDIRAAAFQEIIKDPDRKMLAHYELICQQLADVEHQMTDNEKQQYQKTVDEIYSKGCP